MPTQFTLPGQAIVVRQDCIHLKKSDVAIIFSIERGLTPEEFCCWCDKKEVWEYLKREDFLCFYPK